ncbi:hypothetical protein GCM10023094_45290 [Rhodococcus olei]|uniref:Uncharacterized protein n=1 Tax=Rhodococcus olei TaxID=2161675 RepID=A0ABP8PGQ9_9NOCA
MIATKSSFVSERAPCGGMYGGERHVEDDSEGLQFDDMTYECGCRRIRHVFHDGSIRVRIVRHDGKVLVDEHSGDHEA